MLSVSITKVFITVFFLISACIIYFFLAIPYYSGDVKNHVAWAVSFLQDGTLGFYEKEIPGFYIPNYPPITIWLFTLGESIYQLTKQWVWYLNVSAMIFPSKLVSFWEWENVRFTFLKLPAILANILLAYGVYLLLPFIKKESSERQRILVSGLFLFNPASIYLSALWGQIDFLPVAFLVFAFYLLFKSRIYWSAVLIVLALLSKQTVVIFLAFYMFLVWRRFGWQILGKAIVIVLVLFYLAFLPFHQFSLTWPPQFYLSTFSSVVLTVGENVFNFWGFLFDFKKGIPDSQIFLFLTYYQWGILLMSVFLSVPILIFLKRELSTKKIMVLLLLISLVYFFFLTRLHERHLAPSIVFATLLAAVDKRYWVSLVFISGLFLLNMYNGSFQPNIELFNKAVSSLIFIKLLVVGYFLIILYNLYIFIWEK